MDWWLWAQQWRKLSITSTIWSLPVRSRYDLYLDVNDNSNTCLLGCVSTTPWITQKPKCWNWSRQHLNLEIPCDVLMRWVFRGIEAYCKSVSHWVMWPLHFKWKCCVWSEEETKYLLQVIKEKNMTTVPYKVMVKMWGVSEHAFILQKLPWKHSFWHERFFWYFP